MINSDVNSQLDIDNLIGEDQDGITWHYTEFFESEFFFKDSLYHDELKTNIILSKRSGEFSTCQFSGQPITFNIKMYYDTIWEVCNMIELQTNCSECQENLLQYIIKNSSHRKWKTMDGNSFISTKMLGSIKAR